MGRARLLEATDALYHLSARDCWYGQVHEVHYEIRTIVQQHGIVAADSSSMAAGLLPEVFAPSSNCFTNVALWPSLKAPDTGWENFATDEFPHPFIPHPWRLKRFAFLYFFKRDLVFLHISFHVSPMSDPQTDPVSQNNQNPEWKGYQGPPFCCSFAKWKENQHNATGGVLFWKEDVWVCACKTCWCVFVWWESCLLVFPSFSQMPCPRMFVLALIETEMGAGWKRVSLQSALLSRLCVCVCECVLSTYNSVKIVL